MIAGLFAKLNQILNSPMVNVRLLFEFGSLLDAEFSFLFVDANRVHRMQFEPFAVAAREHFKWGVVVLNGAVMILIGRRFR